MKRALLIFVLVAAVVGAVVYYRTRTPPALVLTGIVSTDDVIVSAQTQGRLEKLLVNQGDTVSPGQVVAVIQPQEMQANLAYFQNTQQQLDSQVAEAQAVLRFQEAQASSQIAQARANLAAAEAAVAQGNADLENDRLTLHRETALYKQGVESAQAFDQARTAFEAQQAHVDALRKQQAAAEAAVALARSSLQTVEATKAAVEADEHQRAAAAAQADKARVQLGYTQIKAPIAGIVDVRAALQGEVVNPGQAIVTLVDPDQLWVRADVEETYIDRIHLGDKLLVRLPSGAEREGTVFYRAVDADYATQRDVSRTKRDIKTFEIRLRCDNRDRALALGMTAYVTLPFGP